MPSWATGLKFEWYTAILLKFYWCFLDFQKYPEYCEVIRAPTDLNAAILLKFYWCFLDFQKYPEYYEVIRAPIDLKTIAMKIQEGKYQNLDELEKDLHLMVRNAQTYNDPKSLIFKVWMASCPELWSHVPQNSLWLLIACIYI